MVSKRHFFSVVYEIGNGKHSSLAFTKGIYYRITEEMLFLGFFLQDPNLAYLKQIFALNGGSSGCNHSYFLQDLGDLPSDQPVCSTSSIASFVYHISFQGAYGRWYYSANRCVFTMPTISTVHSREE